MKHTVRTYDRNLRSSSRRRSSTPSKSTSFSSFLKRMLKSLLFTLLCGLLLILIFSLGVYFYPDPDTLIPPLALLASALTALLGGIFSIRIHGQGILLSGLCNGCATTAALMLLSLFFTKHASGYSAGIALLLHAAFLLLSVLGAYLGMRRAAPKKWKKRY